MKFEEISDLTFPQINIFIDNIKIISKMENPSEEDNRKSASKSIDSPEFMSLVKKKKG